MSYTEKIIIDKIEILEDFQIQIRESTKIYKNGIEIAKTYKRHCISPDISSSDLDKEDSIVKSIARLIFTDEVKNKYNENKIDNSIN